MAQPLSIALGLPATVLRAIADYRLRDFEILWKGDQWHTAVYMAGYAVEAYLKCAICKTLKIPQLPKEFEYHKLDSLLLYSGYDHELRSDLVVFPSFLGIQGNWNVEMRYEDPGSSKFSTYNHALCVDVDKWLNDATIGLVPWFRTRLP